MTVARRGLTVLVGGTALAMSVAVPAMGAPSHPGTTGVKIVHACSQSVRAGDATCFALRRADLGYTSRTTLAAHPNVVPSGYGPSSLQSAYKLPSSTAGSGQRVYVVDAYNDPNAESDLGVYRSQYGLPSCTTANGCFKKLNQNGATSPLPAGDTGWAGEISLDLDMVSAICPNCGITLLEANTANDADLYTAVRTANSLGAKFVSMSWGGPENGSEASNDANFSATGVVYTASTGDSGYSAGVIYPSTSSRVVSVGGTSLTTASNTRGFTESAWSGAGSGCSSDETKPSWQSVVTSCTRRADADVSAVADPNTGLAVYLTYGGSGWTVYGGTSASAPIIASTYALAGTPAAGTNPASVPYAHTGNLFDVTSGSNGSCSPSNLCHGVAGWDGPTGLGTPNGVAGFGGSGGGGGNTVTVNNPGNRTGTVGTAVSLQITGSDSGGAALTYSATGLPTGLSISSSGLISGTPSTAGAYNVTVTATDTTGASGSAAFTWTINPVGGGCGSTGQKLGNPGFETGSAAPWSASAGVIDNSSAEPAHSGSWKAWLDGYGSTHTDTLTQSVTIPSGCSATLSFYLHIDTAETTTATAYDKLTVKLGTTTLATYSNLNKNSGYLQRSFNVSSFAGQTVTLSFSGSEDSSLQTSFVVDDTALTAS